MGAAATFVLLGCNMAFSALRKVIPDKVRIPAFIVIICTFVTIIQLLMQAFLPSLYESLGIFIPLIVVNCIILARAEAFASKNGVLDSALDGLGIGLGFTVALLILATIREILGNGTFLGYPVFGANFPAATIMILPAGGFLTLGVVIAAINHIRAKKGV